MDKNTEEKILKFMNPETMCILAIIALCFIVIPPVGLIIGIFALVRINKDPLIKGKSLAIIAIITSLILLIGLGSYGYYVSNQKIVTNCSVNDNIGCNSERIYR